MVTKINWKMYQDKKWGFSFSYPEDWIIISKNISSGTWDIPITVGNKEGTGGPADFIVSVKKVEVLKAYGDNPNIEITDYYDDGTTDTYKRPSTPTEYLQSMKSENNITKSCIISEEESMIAECPAIDYTFYEPTNKKVISRVITVFGKKITFQFKCQTPSKEFKKFNPVFSDIINSFTITTKSKSTKYSNSKTKEKSTIEDSSSGNKCPNCGYIMAESDWRCPKCYHEFEDYFEAKSTTEELSLNDTKEKKEKKKTSWWGSAAAGAFGGAISGIIASHGSGKLGFAGFIVFLFTMIGVNGGVRKAFAGLIFIVVASFVFVLFKQ